MTAPLGRKTSMPKLGDNEPVSMNDAQEPPPPNVYHAMESTRPDLIVDPAYHVHWIPTGSFDRGVPLPTGPFFYPHTVNAWEYRCTALQIALICIPCIIWRDEPWAAWVGFGLALDFLLRLVGGGGFSPAGALAMVATVPLKEDLRNGLPKQLGTLVWLCFAVAGAALLFNEQGIAGAVMFALIALASFIEAFFDFCLGCLFFGWMVDCGLVSPAVYQVHIDQKPVVQKTLELIDDFETELKELKTLRYVEVGQPKTAADLTIKQFKTDDHVRRGFNPVKYVNISDCVIPLSVGGVGLAWRKHGCSDCFKKVDHLASYVGDNEIWKALSYISVAIFSMLLALLIAKLIFYPRKFGAELIHPVRSNLIATMPMCLCLYSILLTPHDDEHMAEFRKALFWMGALPLKLLVIWKAASLVGKRGDAGLISPALMLPIGGCLLAALNAGLFKGYGEIAWALFGLPAVLSLLLFGTTFTATITTHWSDERARAVTSIWGTILHLMMLAYKAIPRDEQMNTYTYTDVAHLDMFSKVLFWAGVSLDLMFLWLCLPMNFVFKAKFDPSFWEVGIVTDLLAITTQVYLASMNPADDVHLWGEYFASAALFVATWSNLTLLLNTIYILLKRRWMRPGYKFGPMAFGKLVHTALRESGKRLLKSTQDLHEAVKQDPVPLSPLSPMTPGAVNPDCVHSLAKGLAAHLQVHLLVLDWHHHIEDTIIFRKIDAFHPMVARNGYVQHRRLRQMQAEAEKLQKCLAEGADVVSTVGELRTLLEKLVPFSEANMRWEEENLHGVQRKCLNGAVQGALVSKIWATYCGRSMEEIRKKRVVGPGGWSSYDFTQVDSQLTYFAGDDMTEEEMMAFPPTFPEEEMPLEKQQILRVAMPFVIHWLPIPALKARFARVVSMAVPEEAQMFGDMVYRGVTESTWAVLAKDCSEIIPRGLPGWVRRV